QNESIVMISCDICDAQFEHRLEVVEHQASLSHQIRLGSTLQKGEKRFCPVCSFSCLELAEYSKHVDSDSHIAKLRALRSKRIAMVDSCFPSKNSRWESPAYRPVNFAPSSSYPPHPPHLLHPPHMDPNHFNSFIPPHVHNERPPYKYQQRGNPQWRDNHIHMQQPGPSNRRSINGKGKKGSPKEKKKKEEIMKKKMGGVISKVMSAAAIVKKKKEIVTTPKVTSMDNKSKRYESLALKGGMVSSNKSRTQVMMMERQNKYSLVDGQGGSIEESRGNVSSSSIPSITAPPPFSSPPHLPHPPHHLYPPSPHPSSSHHPPSTSSSSLDVSFAPSSSSNSTYAFCHPVHSTPHQLHDSNWPEFVRGIEALHEDTPSIPSTSAVFPHQKALNASYGNGGRLDMRRVKVEVRDEMEEEIEEITINRPIKQEPPSDHTLSMDSLNQKINQRDSKWKMEYEEQKKKLLSLSNRREEARRRFEDEMRAFDEEEGREKEKLIKLESTRASFQNDLRKVLQSHGF
ncbi:hypothetical protein PENTCL1PPCAC_17516, partial [Pristionchus entomophagus]